MFHVKHRQRAPSHCCSQGRCKPAERQERSRSCPQSSRAEVPASSTSVSEIKATSASRDRGHKVARARPRGGGRPVSGTGRGASDRLAGPDLSLSSSTCAGHPHTSANTSSEPRGQERPSYRFGRATSSPCCTAARFSSKADAACRGPTHRGSWPCRAARAASSGVSPTR
jgi:hypothetical protein